jgi:hypothetical protein
MWNWKTYPGSGASFPGRGFFRSSEVAAKIDLALVFILKKYYYRAGS